MGSSSPQGSIGLQLPSRYLQPALPSSNVVCWIKQPGAQKGQEHGKAGPAPARSHHRGLAGLSPTPQHRGRASPGAGTTLQSTMPCWPLHSGGANTRGEHAHSPQHRPQPDPRARFPVTCCFSSDKAPGEKLRLRFVGWLGAW